MAKLASEFDALCPCCGATLVIDVNLRRVVDHVQPERGDKRNLDEAQQILAKEAAKREAQFEESFRSERSRGDSLAKRFDEALQQARHEPVTRPTRDFDLE